ncbi:MAG: hypothetical protein HY937_01135 [Nitrosomonadales bacterium]|nr:hypothetical protein [Nitrosomonadales bacterium]
MFPTASLWIVLSAAVFTLSACVTINIYFPAAAAEKAADKIIDEVWQIKKNDTEPSNKSVAPENGNNEPAAKGIK